MSFLVSNGAPASVNTMPNADTLCNGLIDSPLNHNCLAPHSHGDMIKQVLKHAHDSQLRSLKMLTVFHLQAIRNLPEDIKRYKTMTSTYEPAVAYLDGIVAEANLAPEQTITPAVGSAA